MSEEQPKGWITDDRDKIIEIYEHICSGRCPGLKPGYVLTLTNDEILDRIFKFVKEHVEPIV